MPELPEVETVRRGLDPVLTGARIAGVDQRRPDLRWPLPDRMADRLTGAGVDSLSRRSKTLLAGLDTGETLLIHLGMSGRVLIHAPGGAAADRTGPGRFHHAHPALQTHDHVIFDLTSGVRIVYNDPRRFGAMDLWPSARIADHPWLVRLGPEPLGNAFNAPGLRDRLDGRKTPIKTALLDQRIVAGLGNIYVCESLHRAGIAPTRPAGRIALTRLDKLVTAIRDVLAEAIAAGGSSLRDYRQADGDLGYFQHRFRVYDRADAPCPTAGCAGTIRRIVQAGRSTYHCPRCQR